MFSKTVTRNLHDVVIVSAARTPMGSFQSALSSFSAPQLGSIAIAEAVKVKLKGFLSHFINKRTVFYFYCFIIHPDVIEITKQ